VSIFVNYARALIASQRRQENNDNADMPEQSSDDRSSSTSYRDAADNANTLILNPPPVEVGSNPHDNEGGNRGPTLQNTTTSKDVNMIPTIPTLINDAPRPPLSRLPEMMEVPNWATMSNSIADSFGLFEEGQNDIFDFLHTMPSIPQ
jgi:hypothetical protein